MGRPLFMFVDIAAILRNVSGQILTLFGSKSLNQRFSHELRQRDSEMVYN